MAVEVSVWDAAGNKRTVSLGLPGSIVDLSGLKEPVAAFRYRIDLDGGGSPDPLLDTPVFEAIQFSIRRRRVWTAWRQGHF